MNKIRLLSIMLVICCGCSKSVQNNDQEKPSLKIYYPAAFEYYQPGQQLCFKALVEDNSSLNRVSVFITNQAKTVKHYEFIPGTRIFLVDQKYLMPENISGPFNLEFEAVDNHGNSTKVTLPLSVKL